MSAAIDLGSFTLPAKFITADGEKIIIVHNDGSDDVPFTDIEGRWWRRDGKFGYVNRHRKEFGGTYPKDIVSCAVSSVVMKSERPRYFADIYD